MLGYTLKILKYSMFAIAAIILLLFGYGAKGYLDAVLDAEDLREQADTLMSQGRGGLDLGSDRLEALINIEDPAFYAHAGIDFTTDGTGNTTISQSVSKRLAFKQFRPGLGKIRQTGYALGLEQSLTKDQILALWLDTLEMGRGPDGWMTGFYEASAAIYGCPPAEVSEHEFLRLAAVLIAPAAFDLRKNDLELDARVQKIERLLAGQCTPLDHGDVWLEGCR